MDADARRMQVADALLRVVARDGLAGAKLVNVADEAGVSVGLVQSYFRSKTDLLRFAVEALLGRAERRIDDVRSVRPLREALYLLAELLLPLDDDRRDEAAVWLAFLPVTLTDPEMAAMHRAAIDHQLAGVGRAFAASRTLGELTGEVDAPLEAMALTAFLDGLSNYMVTMPRVFDDESARRMLRRYLDRIFEGEK